MKLAGYPSGKYTGGETLQVVGSTGEPGRRHGPDRQSGAGKPRLQDPPQPRRTVGHVREVLRRARRRRSTCARTSAGCATSPIRRRCSTSRSTDPRIMPDDNSNWGQVNNPQINAAMEKAALVVGEQARGERLGQDRRNAGRPGGRGARGLAQRAAYRGQRRRRRRRHVEQRVVGLRLHLAEVTATPEPSGGATPERAGHDPMLPSIRRVLWGVALLFLVVGDHVRALRHPALGEPGRTARGRPRARR